MPKYTFVCDTCVVEFERTLKMGDHLTHECPSCSEQAPRVWEANAVSFGFKESPKAVPTNTGVHKEDYPTADHLIGKDADKRWEQIHAREQAKQEARQQGGTHALRRKNGEDYIDYEPLTAVGRDARRKLAKATIESIRQKPSR